MGGKLAKVKSIIGLGGPEYRTGLVLSGGARAASPMPAL